MTLANARKITGLDIAQIPGIGRLTRFVATAADKPDAIIAEVTGTAPKAASVLVEKLYRMTKLVVFQEQHWRCAMCLRVAPLTAHHMVPRSKGRSDRRENLIGLDMECHEKVERYILPLRPRAEMLDLLAESGWVWDATVPIWRVKLAEGIRLITEVHDGNAETMVD